VHAVAVARELGITEVVVPYFPGGFSAFGMVASRSRVEYSQAIMDTFDAVGPAALTASLKDLADKCRADLIEQGVAPDDITIEGDYYAMYAGQGQDNRLQLPGIDLDADDLARVAEGFHDFYDRRFGYRAPEIPILVTSVSVVGFGPHPTITLPSGNNTRPAGEGIDGAVILRADLHMDGALHPGCRFYDRDLLREGDEVAGPAVIDDHLGTIVINPGAVARVASHGTLRIEV
jgi:N-methylhydantoinase A